MSVGYATGNALTGLAPTAFTWSTGQTVGRERLNDELQDNLATSGAAAGPIQLTIDFGTATSLVGFALLNHTLNNGASCTVQVAAADDAAFTVNLVGAKAPTEVVTGVEFPNQRDTLLAFPAVSRRYWALVFSFSGSRTLGFGEIQALPALTTLTRNAVYGASESLRYVNNRSDTRTGALYRTFLAGPLRELTLPFVDLSVDQRNELLAMWRATFGGVLPLLWCFDVNSTASAATPSELACMWGALQDTYGWTETDFRLFDLPGLQLVGFGREVGA